MSPASVNRVTSSSTPTSSEGIIDKFLDAIWMERGLSTNTLGAYRADLLALQRWLAQRDTSLMYATRADLLAFIANRAKEGAKPRSTARQLSSFRRFYRFLLREGVIQEDPTVKIEMPKIGRSLPKSLTEIEVESLLAAPGDLGSAGSPGPGHARSPLCHGPARLRTHQPEAEPGQPEPGRAAHPWQGRPGAAHSARRGIPALGAGVHDRPAGGDPAGAAERVPVSHPPGRPHDAPGLLAHHQALREEGRHQRQALARTRSAMPSPRTC